MIIDNQPKQTANINEPERQSWPVLIMAKVVSFVFHPLFIPTYITVVLLWLQPLNKLLIDDFYKPRRLAMVFLYTGFFPAFVVFLLWRLKFIKSIFLREQKDRIIPFVASMFFFFWIYYVARNLPDFPVALKQFLLGVFLSSAAALFANIYLKISMHGLAMGGLVAFVLLQQLTDIYWNHQFILIILPIAGLVCSTRLVLNAHKQVEVYAGFFVGMLCQLGAWGMV